MGFGLMWYLIDVKVWYDLEMVENRLGYEYFKDLICFLGDNWL